MTTLNPQSAARPAGVARVPRQARSRASLARILDAAEALVESRPLSAITVAAIASRAGISVGNFYKRFASKEAVLEALYARFEAQRTEHLTRATAVDPGGGLDHRARWLVTTLVRLFLARRGVIRAYVMHYRSAPGATDDAMKRRLERLYRNGAAVLMGAADEIEHADPAKACRFATLMAASLCRELILFKEPGEPGAVRLTERDLIDHLTRTLLGYLRGPASGRSPVRRRRPSRSRARS